MALIPALIFALATAARATADVEPSTAPPEAIQPPPPLSSAAVAATIEGDRWYYKGEPQKALAAYQKALARDSRALKARLSGSVVLEETGQLKDAARWLEKARMLSRDPKIPAALGWVELRRRDAPAAQKAFQDCLAENPRELFGLIGLGRVHAALGRPREAAGLYQKASALDSPPNVLHYWLAQALEADGDAAGSFAEYKKAIVADSYFVEARYALGRALMRANRYNEALTQFMKMVDVDPESSLFKSLKRRILAKAAHPLRELSSRRKSTVDLAPLTPGPGQVPILRVGIGSNAMGKPLPRKAVLFRCDTPFELLDAKSGKRLAAGEAKDTWVIRSTAGKKSALEISRAPPKGPALKVKGPVRIRPDVAGGGVTRLSDIPYGQGFAWSGVGEKALRGEVEIALLSAKRGNLRIVNLIDLESYTHGLLSAEMPINSPIEALKAQSVVARSEALYMKQTFHRHRKEGYDVCDEQHCQVYAGVAAESERSRGVVNATRGRILAYHGRIAHGIYSSNCGGHTQAGREINGWGDVGYWPGVRDAPAGSPDYPSSPWDLRWWLRETPTAFCMPTSSGYVHPSHYRWSRVVPAKELQERINRTLKVGRILRIEPLRRAASGHVNAVLVVGSRKRARILHETRIRNLLGLGSQRSTLFSLETEYDAEQRPESFVFYGGGWGHGVGMCQSGAMGRAEQGQTYVDILRAYYPTTELGNLNY